jgi:hypothetical protein
MRARNYRILLVDYNRPVAERRVQRLRTRFRDRWRFPVPLLRIEPLHG